jgi:O-methyltransferase
MDTRAAYLEQVKRALLDLLGPVTTRAVRQKDGGFEIEVVPEEEREKRIDGRDWPANGMTMIGLKRLENIQRCVEDVLADGVPGDLIETGVWRGGATIFMRALLAAHGEPDRRVWVADSFSGVPPPDPGSYPDDEGDKHHTYEFLRVPVEEVKRNFERFGLLDQRVRFLEGSFRDTLPGLSGNRWSVVRIDGDMYESTIVALESLYPDLSFGGYVILDDYSRIPSSQSAVDDFRRENEIDTPLEDIDGTGVFWRKS